MRARIRRSLALSAALCALALAPAAANAHTGNSLTNLPNYTGWAEMSDAYGVRNWTIYKYSASGWQTSTLASGTQVYVYPWSGNWRWGWTQSTSWFALWAPYAQV